MNPKVTIIMPAFNRERYIAESIESALRQTYQDFELIIIDDGSTDKTLEIANKYTSDKRIHIIKNEKNIGIASTRNKALALAKGEYIAPLDSDDIWLDKDKLQKQVTYLDANPKYALVGGGIRHIDKDGKRLKEVVFDLTDIEIRKIILRYNPFAQSSLMYRKKVIIDNGGYDTSFKVCDDYKLWLSVGVKNKFANFPDIFTSYRIHGGNITKTKRLTAAREIMEIVAMFARYYKNSLLGVTKAYIRILLAYVRS